MNMRLALSFLLLAAGAAHAAEPNDFAWGLTLETTGNGAVFEVELPASVYSGVTRPDLGDVRVFNGRGEEVPYTLRRQEMVQGVVPAPRAVPLFPLYRDSATGSDLGLRVQTDARGAIVELKNNRTPESREPEAYLFDLSGVKTQATGLELQWQLPAGGRGFVAHASVSVSDDLGHWRTLTDDATIGDLGYGGNRLERRQIDLPPFSGKYLRVEWPEEARAARVTSAQVRFAAPASYPSRQWLSLEGTPDPSRLQQFAFASGGYFPVDCARVVPRQANTVAQLTLSSRGDQKQPWRARGAGTIYSLGSGKERLASDSFCFEPTSDREWLLSVDQNGGGLGHGRPMLELGWNPQRLVFVARGDGPFTLAWGSAHADAGDASLDPLLEDLESQHVAAGQAAIAGPAFALGGPAQLEPRHELPWRRVALWTLLVGGVLGLGWMAWRLARELNRPKDA